MEAGRVEANGLRLAHEVCGDPDAPPLVMLHALGERGASWASVGRRFAEHFRVVVPDLRGHGDSEWPGTYSSRLMCDDVEAMLDQLGLHRVVLVGHSLGGIVAYLLAMQRPERVERLVVEDVSPPFPRERAVPNRPPEAVDFDWAVVPAIIGEANAGDEAAWAGLAAITAPTLLIGGGPDSHVPQDKLRSVAARIPTCELVTIPVGHEVHATRPARFADVVLGWLQS